MLPYGHKFPCQIRLADPEGCFYDPILGISLSHKKVVTITGLSPKVEEWIRAGGLVIVPPVGAPKTPSTPPLAVPPPSEDTESNMESSTQKTEEGAGDDSEEGEEEEDEGGLDSLLHGSSDDEEDKDKDTDEDEEDIPVTKAKPVTPKSKFTQKISKKSKTH